MGAPGFGLAATAMEAFRASIRPRRGRRPRASMAGSAPGCPLSPALMTSRLSLNRSRRLFTASRGRFWAEAGKASSPGRTMPLCSPWSRPCEQPINHPFMANTVEAAATCATESAVLWHTSDPAITATCGSVPRRRPRLPDVLCYISREVAPSIGERHDLAGQQAHALGHGRERGADAPVRYSLEISRTPRVAMDSEASIVPVLGFVVRIAVMVPARRRGRPVSSCPGTVLERGLQNPGPTLQVGSMPPRTRRSRPAPDP